MEKSAEVAGEGGQYGLNQNYGGYESLGPLL